jgi:restriction system protein
LEKPRCFWKFEDALQGLKARKNVLFTTGSYSNDASEFVKQLDSKIVLIDGAELSTLIIEYGVGVRVQRVVKVMRLDVDYLAESVESYSQDLM